MLNHLNSEVGKELFPKTRADAFRGAMNYRTIGSAPKHSHKAVYMVEEKSTCDKSSANVPNSGNKKGRIDKKKKGKSACFICNDPDHFMLKCPFATDVKKYVESKRNLGNASKEDHSYIFFFTRDKAIKIDNAAQLSVFKV